MKRLAIISVSILLSACQPSVQELRRELDKGVGGYTGQVTPFSVPYLLRYRPIANKEFSFRITVRDLNGTSKNSQMRGGIAITSIGEQLIWNLVVEEFVDAKGQVVRSANPPLFVVRMSSSSRGKIAEVDLDFPALRGRADVPTKDSDIYKNMVNELKATALELPEQPLRVGDAFFTSQQFLERVAEAANLPMPALGQIMSTTLVGRVAGQTVRNNRTYLVVHIFGSIEIRDGNDDLTVGMIGHCLLDVQTSHAISGVVALTVVLRNKTEIRTAEAIVRYDAAP